jgi:RHS repeat-associated protein
VYDYNGPHKHAVDSITLNSVPYSYTYDPNGNLTNGADFTNLNNITIRTIEWNADNMPTHIDHSVNGITTFTYDGDGVRVMKASSGTTTYYVNDNFEVKGSVPIKYIFAGNLRAAQIEGTDIHIFHKDHLNSSSAITDDTSVILESSEYLPFGGIRAHTGQDISDYKFTDQEHDSGTGFYNYDARLYDPVIGRFISADSEVPDWTNPQSLNRYSYCRNNPLIYVDPSGNNERNPDGTYTYSTSDAYANSRYLWWEMRYAWLNRQYGSFATGGLLYLMNSIGTIPLSMATDMVLVGPYNAGVNYTNGFAEVIQGGSGRKLLYSCSELGFLAFGGKLMAPSTPASVTPKSGLSNAQLVQKVATKAERKIGGADRFAGTDKHNYATELLKRFQKIHGDRGLRTKEFFNNGPGNRGFLDVLDTTNEIIYDWKFGYPNMSPLQLNQTPQMLKYQRNFDLPTQVIKP